MKLDIMLLTLCMTNFSLIFHSKIITFSTCHDTPSMQTIQFNDMVSSLRGSFSFVPLLITCYRIPLPISRRRRLKRPTPSPICQGYRCTQSTAGRRVCLPPRRGILRGRCAPSAPIRTCGTAPPSATRIWFYRRSRSEPCGFRPPRGREPLGCGPWGLRRKSTAFLGPRSWPARRRIRSTPPYRRRSRPPPSPHFLASAAFAPICVLLRRSILHAASSIPVQEIIGNLILLLLVSISYMWFQMFEFSSTYI